MQFDPTVRGKRRAPAAAALALALLAAACSSGPTDFVDLATTNVDATPPAQVRSPADKAAVARSLTAAGDRAASRAAAADDGLPSAMALAVIRQQQNEDAKALLAEASGSTVAPAKPACPDGLPPEANGTCLRP